MDEILIEEKKYISSKQAAKVTGYAKDYIGQLCREGRVPARLVGRSWYVLESAIHDHRFGEQKTEREVKVDPPPASLISSAWGEPRYEAFKDEELPSVNLLHDKHENIEKIETPQHLQNTWKLWFDRFDNHKDVGEDVEENPANESEADENLVQEANDNIDIEMEKGVRVPIRAIHPMQYKPPPQELLPRRFESFVEEDREQDAKYIKIKKNGPKIISRMIKLIGVLLVAFIVFTAAIGSGYFDKYILSNNQVMMLSGVSIYNK